MHVAFLNAQYKLPKLKALEEMEFVRSSVSVRHWDSRWKCWITSCLHVKTQCCASALKPGAFVVVFKNSNGGSAYKWFTLKKLQKLHLECHGAIVRAHRDAFSCICKTNCIVLAFRADGSGVLWAWNCYFWKTCPRVDKSENDSLVFTVNPCICWNNDVITPHLARFMCIYFFFKWGKNIT